MFLAVNVAELSFFQFMLYAIGICLAIAFSLCFVIIPLGRYLFVRTVLFFRCCFCKAKFRPYGFMSFIVPHFWNDKPDYMLLSGNKLYLIKLRSYRKVKSIVTILDSEHWTIESKRGLPVENTGTTLNKMVYKVYSWTVNKRYRRPPNNLVRYCQQANMAIADDPVDCVPVLLVNPTIETFQTSSRLELVDGDTVYYGILTANSFFPGKPVKSVVSGKEARKIFRKVRVAMRTLDRPFVFTTPLNIELAERKAKRKAEKEEQERLEAEYELNKKKGYIKHDYISEDGVNDADSGNDSANESSDTETNTTVKEGENS